MTARLLRLMPGSLFASGRFRIEAPIGSGAMGVVYRAVEAHTGRPCALKVMHPPQAEDAPAGAALSDEACLPGHIRSPHVARVLASGVDADHEAPWMAMELLRGQDLGSLLEARGPLALPQTLAMCAQLCDALGAAHDAGIVHRDVKPENVFLAHDGQRLVVKLLDFGISAKGQCPCASAGTPAFMAPEQFLGADAAPGADVWSLGLLVFRLLTGRYFWRSAEGLARPGRLMHEVLSAPVPAGSRRAAEMGASFPATLDAWLARCLERDPSKRYADARAAFEALARAARVEMRRPRSQRPSALVTTSSRSIAAVHAMAMLAASLVVGFGTAFAVAAAIL
jgi:serine/threonine protein kinase